MKPAQYSGNSGVSWVVQAAPTIPNTFYELNQVAVLKGTVAFAVGGNPFGTDGTLSLNAKASARPWARLGALLLHA